MVCAKKKPVVVCNRSLVALNLSYTLLHRFLQVGAGDTYFSGKMLAKLARILIVAEEVGATQDVHQPLFTDALARLRAGVEIWLNGMMFVSLSLAVLLL